jgi:hypothetical protein
VIASFTGLRAVCVGGAAVAALFGIFTMIRWRPSRDVVTPAATPS